MGDVVTFTAADRVAPVAICCPRPGCSHVAHGTTEGVAIKVLSHHLVKDHMQEPSLAANLAGSLEGRRYPSGTFGAFVESVMALGVTAETPLSSIEFGVSQMGTGRLVVEFDGDAVEIREGTVYGA